MAVLHNLRLMAAAGVSPKLIRQRLSTGVARALPFRFVTAARYAPKLQDAIEEAMLKGISGLEKLPGATGLVVDVSGSMDYRLSRKGEATRMDAAAGLAILLREKSEEFAIASFSDTCVSAHGAALYRPWFFPAGSSGDFRSPYARGCAGPRFLAGAEIGGKRCPRAGDDFPRSPGLDGARAQQDRSGNHSERISILGLLWYARGSLYR